jgi:hypothetical protein
MVREKYGVLASTPVSPLLGYFGPDTTQVIYFNKLPKGGHCAAWGQPAFFVSDVRAAFKSLRTIDL